MKVFIKSLNSCVMRKGNILHYRDFIIANGHKIVNDPASSDIILVWTCGFRADVRDNSAEQLLQYDRKYSARVIAAGCLPDIAPELLKVGFSGEILPWRSDQALLEQLFGRKHSFEQMSPVFAEKSVCNDIVRYRVENPDKDVTFHDQFIKLVVSEGCSFECSYCSERLAFPEFHSFPEDDLVEICRSLVEETGCLKVILLADSLGEYGRDIGSNLPSLLCKLKTIDPNLTFALNNLNLHNFIQYFDEMAWFIENNYICHLNLPIQSASMRILERMNRAYTRDDIDRVFGLLSKLGFKDFDTHIIVGFPGEAEDDFNETVKLILHYHPKYVLINKYMESSGAASASYSDVVSDKIAIARIRQAEDCFNAAGIICNSEKGELIQNRLKALNAQ